MRTKHLLTKTLLLLAVLLTGAGTAWAESVTISPTQALNDGGVDPITIVCAKGDGTSNPAISSGQLRLYQAGSGKTTGNTITFSSEKTITSIVFTFANSMTAENGVFSEGNYDSSNYTWSGSTNSVTLTVTGTTSGKRIYITEMVVYYEDGGDTPTLEDSDFALENAPVALNFDLYNNADAQVINYTTSSTGDVTVSASEFIETVVDEDAQTITVTPLKKTNGAVEITVNQAADENYKAGSATFTITISDSTPKTGGWVLTDLNDLTEDDVFVIVGNNGKTYAMSNDNGTGNAPTAVKITISNGEIEGDVAENIQWTISGNATDGYTFYPNGDTEKWLYCTNTNNGVRVGINDNKTFTITDGYLYNTATSRYVGIYNSQDWRCYTSINSNITDEAFAFYKYEDNNATTVKAPVITVDETFIGSTTATITCATEGATIFYSYNGEVWTEYTEALTITETTTIYAKAQVGEDESAVVSKTTTKTLPTPTVTIDATGITNTDVYTSTEAGSLTANVTYNDAAIEGATVTWSGNNDKVATINETTGAVTLVAAGSVTFTATFAGNAEYNGATDTYVLTVTNTDPDVPGTVNNPFTVAQAIDVIKALPNSNVTTEKYYIKGIVSSFQKKSIVDDGSYYRYFISDDGTTTTQLQVFMGKGLNEATFTNADDLLVGDEVVIYGPIQYYNSNVPEIAEGNYIVSLNRPVVASIDVSTNLIEATADGVDGTITVTYNNITDVAAEVYFCDADGAAATYDWIQAEINNENNVYYVINANDGEARTAYMKVYALDDEAKDVYSELITISQAKYVAPEVTIGKFVKVTSTDDVTSGQYLIVYEDGNLAFDGSRDDSNDKLDAENNTIDVTIENGKIAATATNAKSVFNIDVTAGTLQSASGKYIGVTSNSNGLKTSTDPEAFTHTFSIDEDGNAVIAAAFEGSTMTLRYNKASDNLRFRYYKSGQQAIQLYKFVADAEAVEVAVTAAGYATYCSESDLDFSNTAITAYKAKITGTDVSFKEVKQVPAGEGVLLKANEGTYAVPVAAYAAANTDNAFIGVTEETVVDPGIFVLLNGNKGVGFYKTTKAFTVGANTAYLPALAGGAEGARSFIGFDNMVTAIEGIAAEKMLNGEVYNLQGQRMVAPQKGLYIINGKKVVIK